MRKILTILTWLLLFLPTETISITQQLEPVQGHILDTIEIPEPVKLAKFVSLGEFKVTAYCSCKKCCYHYAINRPKDENGNEIVYGSTGKVLTPQYSIAVDPRVIPYGTKVYFNKKEHLAQDCGGAIKQNRIDLYFDNHQEALEWGVKYFKVAIFVTPEDMGTEE